MGKLSGVLVACLLIGAPIAADVPIESVGRVESLPPRGDHWIWVADIMYERNVLVDLDGDDQSMLGMVSVGYGPGHPVHPRAGAEFYVPETHYSRGTRGERTDVLTIYDATTLVPVDEVVIPPKRALPAITMATAALSDDDRFAAVFNLTPATSLSIVDVVERRFAGEIATPGCSLAYAGTAHRFHMVCQNGALLTVTLDEHGNEVGKRRSDPFFDPETDPVTEKAVRVGDTWIFVSYDGYAHPVDVSAADPVFGERWSLLSDADRDEQWRIGGNDHLAVHEGSGRLYSLVHQGGVDTHKHPGSELWVYDLAKRERLQRIELLNPGITYLGTSLEFGRDWVWPFNGLYEWLLSSAPMPGIDLIEVTADDAPLLVTAAQFSGSLAVYDALSGEFLRRVNTGNVTNFGLHLPSGGSR